MAEAVVPGLGDRHDRRLGDLRPDVGAELAIHGFPHRIVVRKDEPQIHDAGGRDERGEDQRGQVEELDAAVADLRQKIGVRSELIGRKEIDFQAPARRFLDAIGSLLGANIDRMRRVLSGCELVGELRRRSGATEYARTTERLRRPGATCDE